MVLVYSISNGSFTNDSNDIITSVIIFAFGLSAQIERQLISERTKAGLIRAEKAGKHIGRPKGRKPRHYKLTGRGAYIRRKREKGKSKAELARELDVTCITLNKYMVYQNIK